MKTIIVATDFSPAANNAAHYAAEMAAAINAKLLLLHVYQVPVVYLELPVVLTEVEMIAAADEKIIQLKNELDISTGHVLNFETEIRTGVFFQELKDVCEKLQPYTVIMGCQGTTAAERIFFGSHAVYAMKHLDWPLITVPAGVRFNAIKKIGLACDFAKVVDTIPVHEIEILVNDFNAALHVLNTGKQTVFNPDIVFQSGLLQQMLVTLNPTYHFTTNPDTDEGIMDFAERNHLDLLLVLPKRHGFTEKLLHKSHTKQLVLHSHVPVMALHQ